MKTKLLNNLSMALITLGFILIAPDALASTGGGGLSGLVDELKEMLDSWIAQTVIICAFIAAAYQSIKNFNFMALGGAVLLALVMAYGPDFLLSLSGALI